MNETDQHPELRIRLTLGSKIFVAGEDVYGKMEVECTSADIGIRTIQVSLIGVERLISKHHAATSTFMDSVRIFQGQGLPPSNAVQAPSSYDPDMYDHLPPHYHPSRKGSTTFFFKHPLPSISPGSISFVNGLARVSYEIKASVEVAYAGKRQRVVRSEMVDVVEALDEASWEGAVSRVVLGEGGKLWVQAKVLNGLVLAGRPITCELYVRNNSIKKVSGVTLSVVRRLHIENLTEETQQVDVSDTLISIPFHRPEYTVQAFSEGVASLVITVPRDARGVRPRAKGAIVDRHGNPSQGSLFDIQCFIVVRLGLGYGNPDMSIEIPVQIYHGSAIPSPLRHLAAPMDTGQSERPPSPPPLRTPQAPFAFDAPPSQPPSPLFHPYSPASLSPMNTFQPMYPAFSGPVNHTARPVSPYYAPPSPIHSPAPPTPLRPLSPNYVPHYSPPRDSYQVHTPLYLQPTSMTPPVLPYAPVVPVSHVPAPVYHPPPPSFPSYPSPYVPVPEHTVAPFNSPQTPTVPDELNLTTAVTVSPARIPPQVSEPTPMDYSPGERASRISKHLRLSSRNRSVSPTPQRSSVEPLTLPIIPSTPPAPQRDLSSPPPSSSSAAPPVPVIETPSPSQDTPVQSPPILSPLPRLSPSKSYFDVSSRSQEDSRVRSARVEELEQFVAQSEREGDTSSVKKENQGDKGTIRVAPRSGGRFMTKSRTLPSAMDVFHVGVGDAGTSMLEPERRTDAGDVHVSNESTQEGGLTLLERRLARTGAPVTQLFEEPRVVAPTLSNEASNRTGSRLASVKEETVAPAVQEMRMQAKTRVAEWLYREKEAKIASTSHRDKPSPRQSLPTPLKLDTRRKLSDSSKASTSPRLVDRRPDTNASKEETTSPRLQSEVKASPAVALTSNSLLLRSAREGDGVLTLKHIATRPEPPPPEVPNKTDDSNRLKTQLRGPVTYAAPSTSPASYDVRSARGGRGGIVTSVTSLWANIATVTNDPAAPPRATKGFTTSVIPLQTRKPKSSAPSGLPSSTSLPVDLQRQGKGEATSNVDRGWMPPRGSAAPRGEVEGVALGQDRLRALIAKYQGGH